MNLLSAFLLRDIAIEKTYRFQLAVRLIDVIFQLSVFYFIGTLVSMRDYFPFVFVGLMFSRFFQFWLNVFSQNIRQEQFWGTAEALFLSPRHPLAVVAAGAMGKFLFLIGELALFLALARYVFGVRLSFSPLGFIMVLAVCGIMFAGIGLVSGSIILYAKRGDPVNWFVSGSFDILSGVYFPVTVLPPAMARIANILPTTGALSTLRGILLEGNPPQLHDFYILSLWAAATCAAGYISFMLAYKKTRQKGELGTY
ncbi:MAG: hypothetical protein A2219_04520 [Elusimicrobia bacterium RIFOXYA2_FULL_50_26]|nr:MAG: hypothetical protein A2219_04520 [Elusimicrobia bacterium RIFOXYA2_FULL_50_26]